jgi:hypothetical protein
MEETLQIQYHKKTEHTTCVHVPIGHFRRVITGLTLLFVGRHDVILSSLARTRTQCTGALLLLTFSS